MSGLNMVLRTTGYIGDMFKQIKDDGLYEHDYYYISQLYEVGWKPTHMV
jgi:hypothetical protein